jgi:hypothetical protein
MAKKKARKASPGARSAVDASSRDLPDFVVEQVLGQTPRARKAPPASLAVRQQMRAIGVAPDATSRDAEAAARIGTKAAVPEEQLPKEIRATQVAIKERGHRFHGGRINLAWFPWRRLVSPCADKFGYLTPKKVRNNTKLPFNPTTVALLDQLGELMGNPGREVLPDSPVPAGFTYVGQFVDHDITLDVSSVLDAPTDAETINNMRSPALDLDSVYGGGPAVDPFLYRFPTVGPSSAIRFQRGSNTNTGNGGPSSNGTPAGMQLPITADVPRIHNPFDPAASTNTAVIGDPRNDENLIVSQLHLAMLRFHNKVVDTLLTAGFTGDIFVEARKLVTRHYQHAVLHDFLGRVCGAAAVNAAIASVAAPVDSPFRMPVEFSVAAYRFGHSMIRDNYFVNFNFPNATLAQVFEFIRTPRLPVFSNWVVDFNAFFETGITVPFNKARKIDTVLANGLESLPGFSGMMAVLAQRNLRRGLALGLPSGQGVAKHFGVAPLTAAQLLQGLPPDEAAVLNAQSRLLLKRTPLWYYILREAMILNAGDQLGPVGARIVAETFVRILKRDATSILNVPGGFTPSLPGAAAGDFTFADLVNFAGVTQP